MTSSVTSRYVFLGNNFITNILSICCLVLLFQIFMRQGTNSSLEIFEEQQIKFSEILRQGYKPKNSRPNFLRQWDRGANPRTADQFFETVRQGSRLKNSRSIFLRQWDRVQTQEQQIKFSMSEGTKLGSEESKNNRCKFLGVGFFQHSDQQIEISRSNICEKQIFKKRSSLDA